MIVAEVLVRALSARRKWVASTAQGLLEEVFELADFCRCALGSVHDKEQCDVQRLGAITMFLKTIRVPFQHGAQMRLPAANTMSLLDIRNAARLMEQRASSSISGTKHPNCIFKISAFTCALEKKCTTLDDVEDDLKKLFDDREKS
jgi:hypothetical protein